jgi:hypothetical protein
MEMDTYGTKKIHNKRRSLRCPFVLAVTDKDAPKVKYQFLYCGKGTPGFSVASLRRNWVYVHLPLQNDL